MVFKLCLLQLIFCSINSTWGKLPPLGKDGTKKLDDCQSCKVYVKSVNHWLERTSRGKFEGGDADWEETKLKAYSRSELRLVEVQEGLCSELTKNKDDCYSLGEEAEELLENWWFSEDSTTSDFETWLCIEKLAYCCPSQHFGLDCAPCVIGKNRKVCSGQGKCNGEGTRKGDGKCICKKGFVGPACSECGRNFYQTGNESEMRCESCHQSCNGCSSSGPGGCINCNNGWTLDDTNCVDINECEETPCKTNEYCDNVEGSYSCQECHDSCKTCYGAGPNKCNECKFNYVRWKNMCIDENTKKTIHNKLFYKLLYYLGYLIIAYSLIRFSRVLASLAIIAIAIYAYHDDDLKYVSLLFVE